MEFALSEKNERIGATPRSKGFCTICKEPMIPKCGAIKRHHWAHKSVKNCDPWWEPESDWHRGWKNFVLSDFREIVIEKDGIKHRADVRLPSGIVIEFQKSPLAFEERISREEFYEKMIWVLHFKRDKLLEINDRKMYLKLFGDLFIKVKGFNEGFFRAPHPCPIFLDFDDGDMFWINEFDDYDFGQTRWFYGRFFRKIEFINQFLQNSSFSDIEELKISHKHREYEKEQERVRAENFRKREEAWQQAEEERKKQIEEERLKEEEEMKNFTWYIESGETYAEWKERYRKYRLSKEKWGH